MARARSMPERRATRGAYFFQAGGQGCPLGGKIENLKIKKVPAAGSHNR